MGVEIWLRFGVILVLLVLSAFFSSVESAFFSLGRGVLERMMSSSDPRERRVARLMSEPRVLLASILTGNTVVNTAAAAVAALLTVDIAAYWGWNTNLAIGIEVVIATIVILYFCELIPKLQALRDAEKWAKRSSAAVLLTRWVFYPIARPLAALTGGLSKIFGVERHQMIGMTEEEVRALVQVGHEHGALEPDEQKMIHSIFELGDTIAREVMVPRIDIVAAKKGSSLEDLIELITTQGHSRVPVFDGTIDNVIGIVHVKDLLSASQDPVGFDLSDHLRKPYFVPEEKKIDDLLREFQSEKVHMAIVSDEYGGTAGLVTLEDVIEEIVGEIQDEYDKEQPLFTKLDERTLIANGKLSIYDLNQLIGYELVEENDAFDTLAGFVYNQLGAVPKRGDQFDQKGYQFTVEELIGRRITRVKVMKEENVFQDV